MAGLAQLFLRVQRTLVEDLTLGRLLARGRPADIAYVMEQTFVSSRFGEVRFEETDVIEFPWGIPGFDSLRQFVALSGHGNPDVVWLQSLEDPAVALPTGDPWRFFPNYDPLLPAYAVVGLDLSDPDEFSILCVVCTPESDSGFTMNLLAPIVVNLKTRRARQVMLDTPAYSVREPVSRTAETLRSA